MDSPGMDPLKALFRPQSVALIGQSGAISDRYDVTTAPLLYLLKYAYGGRIFPVNPKYPEICGRRCYPALAAIPEPVEAALFLVPADRVIPLLEECGSKGVKAAVITSSGFAETGERGREQQRRIREIARRHGMAVLGPNCNGFINVWEGVSLTFTPILEGERVRPGPIGFVSQSGATMTGIGTRAKEQGMGFSYFIGTGNEAQVDLADCLRFLVEDPQTQVIMALIEGIKDGRKFLEAAELAREKKKPIIALKLGRSEVGRQAALSHTGNLAGDARINRAAFRQKGVLWAEEVGDFIASARLFTQSCRPRGEGIGVISTSGGSAGLVADLIQERGLRVGSLAPGSLEELSKMIRWFATAKNPFDFAGQFLRDETFARKVFDLFLNDEDIHLLLLAMTPVQRHDLLLIREAIAAGEEFQKPVVILYIGGELDSEARDLVAKSNAPFFTSPSECLRAVANLIRYSAFLEKKTSGAAPWKGAGPR